MIGASHELCSKTEQNRRNRRKPHHREPRHRLTWVVGRGPLGKVILADQVLLRFGGGTRAKCPSKIPASMPTVPSALCIIFLLIEGQPLSHNTLVKSGLQSFTRRDNHFFLELHPLAFWTIPLIRIETLDSPLLDPPFTAPLIPQQKTKPAPHHPAIPFLLITKKKKTERTKNGHQPPPRCQRQRDR